MSRTSRVDRHRADPVKSGGVHYTPADLADFVAARAAEATSGMAKIRVLDPSCGEGALLSAFAAQADEGAALDLWGLDTDGAAIEEMKSNLARCPPVGLTVEKLDFLDAVLEESRGSDSLFSPCTPRALIGGFDVVIANPPYVRTQTLGAERAQQLASAFELSGRVDLYHAFVVAMTLVLREGGVLALLCSNRFLTTRSGLRLRDVLRRSYSILGVYDLGDTKVFDAAVLPAVVVARRDKKGTGSFPMVSIYEARSDEEPTTDSDSVFDALAGDAEGLVRVGDATYAVKRGTVPVADAKQPWVPRESADGWVQQVDRRAVIRFSDVGKIRVGIKTTADSVFIRSDWEELEGPAPEADLVHPLITHHAARRWSGLPPARGVLYPYLMSSAKRVPLDLASFPGTSAYFELHRDRLEGRQYLVDSGRYWWEIWVPQRPSEWARPKIVFPDISEEPRFFLDTSGAIVNGDCYWLPVEDENLALLMVGVANSDLGAQYYDAVCGNKLYAGRRRFITQYVECFPIPDPALPEAKRLVEVVKKLVAGVTEAEREVLEAQINQLVRESFAVEEISG